VVGSGCPSVRLLLILFFMLRSRMVSTLRIADASHRILKRRLAWLIGEWVSSDEECAKLPLVWQILVHLLAERGESSDMAVRLTAAIAFKNCVDVRPIQDVADSSYGRSRLIISFHTSNNHLEKCTSAPSGLTDDRIKLLGEASTLPGKKYISTAFGVMIERAQDNVRRLLGLADDRSYLFYLPSLLLVLLFVRTTTVGADDRARCFRIRRRMAIQSVARGPYYQDCHCTS
jgi:hypothetical protein